MILDSHCHLGKKTIIATAKELVASMDKAGIDKSLVFAGKINEKANQELLEDIKDYPDRLYGIGSISVPCEANYKDLDYIESLLAENKIYGLKFYIGYEHYYCYDVRIRPYLNLLIKYNKPAIFHSGDCYNGVCGAKLKYAHPLTFDDLAVEVPDLKIIMAHMGYPWVIDAAEVSYKNKNVYADMSGFVYGDFTTKDIQNYRHVFNEFVRVAGGTDKLIFGTDWPISNQPDYVKVVKELIFNHEFNNKILNNVMGNRAAELFGIKGN